MELLKGIVKESLEEMIEEERQEYLVEHPNTKGNGSYRRDLRTILGEIKDLEVKRTRDGKFHSKLLPYRKRYSVELEELIVGLFASGLSTRKISQVIKVLLDMEFSPQTASRIAEVGVEVIEKWRSRILEEEYAVVYLDSFFFPVRRGRIEKEAISIALGVKVDGSREILGYWMAGSGESSRFWEEILVELKNRGVKHVEVFVVDGLTGLKEVIKRQFPKSLIQECILHAVRNTINRVRKRDREGIVEDLKRVYRVETIEKAKENMERFCEQWGRRYPKVVNRWRDNFPYLFTFMKFPLQIRSLIYTTNQLERLHKEIKRRLKVMEILPEEEKAEKILYLVIAQLNEVYKERKLRNFEEEWQRYLEEKNKNREVLTQTQLT